MMPNLSCRIHGHVANPVARESLLVRCTDVRESPDALHKGLAGLVKLVQEKCASHEVINSFGALGSRVQRIACVRE
jgi:hypothetical protein